MVGLATSFAAVVLERGHNLSIGLPKVAVAQTGFVGGGDTLPQYAAGRCAAATNGIGDDLPGAAAQCQPQPTLILASENP